MLNLKVFDETTCEEISDLIPDWTIAYIGDFDGINCEFKDILLIRKEEFDEQIPARIMFPGTKHLIDENSEIYIAPIATAGDLFLVVLGFGIILVLALKWIFRVLFRFRIDFKQR